MIRTCTAVLAIAVTASALGQAPPPAPKPPVAPAHPEDAPAGEPRGPIAPSQESPSVATPHAPIAPPFVPTAGANAIPPGVRPGEMPAPYIAGARQFLVQPGQSWVHVAREAKPGDEIVFPKGFHIPQRIEGLQGTRERPIFLRSRDQVPAGVVCEDTGWVFLRCSNLVIENILFMNPNKAALVIDGSPAAVPGTDGAAGTGGGQPWPAEITVRNCTIAGSRGPEQDGVRVVRASDVRIDSVRVDGWTGAAVRLEDARRVLVRALMMVPADKLRQALGVAVRGASGEISVTGCSFNKRIRTGVSVGSPAPVAADGSRPAVAPVERMRIDRCIFENTDAPLEIVNARDLVLSRATIVNPTRAIYAIAADAGTVEAILVEKTIGFWFPGTLQTFSPHPGRFPPTSVTLADNLWYSAELPTAWEVLGAPFGYQSVPQVTAIDPSIDVRTLRARNPDAVRFGAYSIAAPGSAASGPAAVPPGIPVPPEAPPQSPAGAPQQAP